MKEARVRAPKYGQKAQVQCPNCMVWTDWDNFWHRNDRWLDLPNGHVPFEEREQYLRGQDNYLYDCIYCGFRFWVEHKGGAVGGPHIRSK